MRTGRDVDVPQEERSRAAVDQRLEHDPGSGLQIEEPPHRDPTTKKFGSYIRTFSRMSLPSTG